MENIPVNLTGCIKLTSYDSETIYSIEKGYCVYCNFLMTKIKQSAEDIIELKLNNITEHIFKKVIEYLEFYKGAQPPSISIPLLGIKLDNIYEGEFDKKFIKSLAKKDLLPLANAASYLENEYLKKVCCAMIAKDLRGKGPEEVSVVLETLM